VIIAFEATALETIATQNWNGRIAIESCVLVRAGTAKEDGSPLRYLLEHESAARTQPDALAPRLRIIVIARHPDSLQSNGHV
jgi:hypothetical protein